MVYDLKNTLKKAGAEEILAKSFNSYAVLPDNLTATITALYKEIPLPSTLILMTICPLTVGENSATRNLDLENGWKSNKARQRLYFFKVKNISTKAKSDESFLIPILP